jgi:hypothetical protein
MRFVGACGGRTSFALGNVNVVGAMARSGPSTCYQVLSTLPFKVIVVPQTIASNNLSI